MELMAVIQALSAITTPCAVTVYCDSQYVVKAWTEDGIRKAQQKGSPVANGDLLEMYYLLGTYHYLTMAWVRGHSNIPGNELADELATQGRLNPDCPVDPGYAVDKGKRVVRKFREKLTPASAANFPEFAPYLHPDFLTKSKEN